MRNVGVLKKEALQRIFGIIDGSRLDENYQVVDSSVCSREIWFGVGDRGKFAAVKLDGQRYAYTRENGTVTERFMLPNGTLGSGIMSRVLSENETIRPGLYVVIPVNALDGSGYMTLLRAADKAGPGGRIGRASWSRRNYLTVRRDGGLDPHLSDGMLGPGDLKAGDWITLGGED